MAGLFEIFWIWGHILWVVLFDFCPTGMGGMGGAPGSLIKYGGLIKASIPTHNPAGPYSANSGICLVSIFESSGFLAPRGCYRVHRACDIKNSSYCYNAWPGPSGNTKSSL